MRDPQTDQLLTEVRQAVVNARAGGATVRACIFNATVAAVDESARAWPSAEARRTADNACRAVEPPTAKAGPVPAAVAPATDRAAVLSEAADDLAEFIALHGPTSRTVAGWRGAVGFLRRLAAEAQQHDTETQAHPPQHSWRVETRDPVADQWAPGSHFAHRPAVVERWETANRTAPLWNDGTPVERRIVRETTTYTVEAEHTPEEAGRG